MIGKIPEEDRERENTSWSDYIYRDLNNVLTFHADTIAPSNLDPLKILYSYSLPRGSSIKGSPDVLAITTLFIITVAERLS